MPVDATLPYDDSNIFARILRGEIPCGKVYEDEHALAFNDINPQAPHHVLVIPEGRLCVVGRFFEPGIGRRDCRLRKGGRPCREGGRAGRTGLPAARQCGAGQRAGSAASPCPCLRREAAGPDARAIGQKGAATNRLRERQDRLGSASGTVSRVSAKRRVYGQCRPRG
jgi:hypothetical protein